MRFQLCAALVFLLVMGSGVKAAKPPKEIQEWVKAFEESVQKSKVFRDEIKNAVKAGAAFYGQPAFLGGNFGLGGQHEYFTFWLFNLNERPAYRAYSINVRAAGQQTLLKTVRSAFERKGYWVAVYSKADDPEQLLYVVVYPFFLPFP